MLTNKQILIRDILEARKRMTKMAMDYGLGSNDECIAYLEYLHCYNGRN